jgi:hypothetical protein
LVKLNKIKEIAEKEIGVTENPSGSNKVKYNTWIYNKDVSGSQYPWCGAFVSWVYDQAGLNLGKIDLTKGFVGCPTAVKNVSKWGKIVTVPQEGDVVFFDWQGDGDFDHTGIFIKDNGKGLFQSIEGNTAFGNDSNGGAVMLRERKYKNCIFIRPNVVK